MPFPCVIQGLYVTFVTNTECPQRYICSELIVAMGKLIQQISGWLMGMIGALVIAVIVLFLLSWTLINKPSLLYSKKKATDKEWSLPTLENDLPEGRRGQQIRYGFLLVSESPKWMGPQAKSHDLQFSGNNLSCKNCHLESGTKPGAASFVGVTNRFPQFRGREGGMGTIEDRINGCMERSMNGKALPDDSPQMEAIVAYMEWLSKDVPENIEAQYKGFAKLKIPDVRADLDIGREVYERECVTCHGLDGQGQTLAGSASDKGYLYPPLWGDDSYNHGAGMNRVITAAQFIKGNMPLGVTIDQPKLSDEEAFHVAAYIDSFIRPEKAGAENDFPDKKLKPVSTPYGPWEDPFSAEQHKYGPFPPIIAYNEKEYGIKTDK